MDTPRTQRREQYPRRGASNMAALPVHRRRGYFFCCGKSTVEVPGARRCNVCEKEYIGASPDRGWA